jgi:hypothetical protein
LVIHATDVPAPLLVPDAPIQISVAVACQHASAGDWTT